MSKAKTNRTKPDCYKCKHRGDALGSAHSSCHHPANKKLIDDPMLQLFATLGSVHRIPSIAGSGKGINVVADSYGIRSGWFQYPFNFDPVWLVSCDGFEASQ